MRESEGNRERRDREGREREREKMNQIYIIPGIWQWEGETSLWPLRDYSLETIYISQFESHPHLFTKHAFICIIMLLSSSEQGEIFDKKKPALINKICLKKNKREKTGVIETWHWIKKHFCSYRQVALSVHDSLVDLCKEEVRRVIVVQKCFRDTSGSIAKKWDTIQTASRTYRRLCNFE